MIALWGRLKEPWLRRFLVLDNGIASQDCFLHVFRALDPVCFKLGGRCSGRTGWHGGHCISSRMLSATELADAVRAHCGIENRLHGMLDLWRRFPHGAQGQGPAESIIAQEDGLNHRPRHLEVPGVAKVQLRLIAPIDQRAIGNA